MRRFRVVVLACAFGLLAMSFAVAGGASGSITTAGERAFCHGVEIFPSAGRLTISDDSCVVNVFIANDGSWVSAVLESSNDAGATWVARQSLNFPGPAGQLDGVAFSPCSFGFGIGDWLFRAHGKDASNNDVYGVFSGDVNVVSCADTTPPVIFQGPTLSPNPVTVGSSTTLTFAVSDPHGAPSGEYWLDADPGVGNATPVYNAPGFQGGGSFTAVISGLPTGGHTAGVRAEDPSGNWSVTTTTTLSVVNDRTPPNVAISSPADGSSYSLGQTVTAAYSCDDLSGIASCAGDVVAGAAIDTSSAGDHTFTVGATDGAGNSTSAVSHYTVLAGPPPGLVTRTGTELLLDGQPFRPIGLNIYNANSNGWCSYPMGGSVLDDTLAAIGPGKNAIRSWFFQQLATTSGSRDWTAFDNTLRAARAHGYKVIATLTDQWGDCGDSTVAGYGYKNTNWYQSAYKQRDPSGTVSYRDWVAEVVARYKNDPTILAWQLVNEPEVLPYKNADCSTVPESFAASTLSAFATDVSGLIKSIDPYHLVSLGTIGSGQCGAQENDFQSLMSIPSVDLCEFHDYNPNQLVPGDIYNGLQRRLDQCSALSKPLLIGEEGVDLNPFGGVTSTAETRRAAIFSDKLCAQFTAGVAGGLLWAWNKNGPAADANNPVYDIGPGDPALAVLTPWGDPTHTCQVASAPSSVGAAAGDGSASVSWLPSASDGGSAISSYTVRSNPGGLTATVNGSLTTTSMTGLSNGTAYTFTVTAENGSGTSPSSAPSNSATPQSGNTAATAIAPPTSSTTVTTGTDSAATGGTATGITVPAGTSGGPVLVTQTATNQTAPTGYVFGGVQIDITAPAATASNPLTLLFTMTPPAGAPLDQTTLGATTIYRAEGTNTAALIPDCTTPVDLTQVNPCVSNRQYVAINGVTYIQVNVLTTGASRWNSARPKPGAVVVSDSGYTPTTVMTQPGGSVGWKFSGKKAHTVTDTIGLGAAGAPLFKSAALSSGSYSFTFPTAGSYPYNSTVKGDSFSGTVAIPAAITPSSGSASMNFSVIWATNTLANYVFDVQYRFKPVGANGWKNWASWKTGIAATHATFTPNQGAGTYAFHVRLRNASNGRASLYSPDVTISVS